MQYETIALLGSNLGLSDLDQVARLNYMCNDLGLDTIEDRAALGVAIEAGLAQFGRFRSHHRVVEASRRRHRVGRLIVMGLRPRGACWESDRVPVALGQAMPGYDPRSLKGNGVTYATSPQGADHTAGQRFWSAQKK